MVFSHGGNPGKIELCRRFEVDFHKTYLIHPGHGRHGTKTVACLHGESHFEFFTVYTFSSWVFHLAVGLQNLLRTKLKVSCPGFIPGAGV